LHETTEQIADTKGRTAQSCWEEPRRRDLARAHGLGSTEFC
jgi:hypothetical protein